jgi:ABC-type sugar transport system permease subunit
MTPAPTTVNKVKYVLTLALAAIMTSCITWADPASASVPDISGDTPGLRIVQHATGGDTIQFFNLDELGPLSHSDSDSSYYSDDLGRFEPARNLLDNIQSALDVDTSRSVYKATDSIFSDDDGAFPTEVTVSTHQNLFADDGGAFELNIDTQKLATVFRTHDIGQFVVGVCPLQISLADDSSRPSSDYEQSTNCRWWTELSASAHDEISVKETPSSGPYWRTLGWYVIGIAITTAVFMGLATLLRRKFRTLGAFNLTMASVGAFLAWLSAIIAVSAIAYDVHSLDEFTLAHNLSGGGRLLAAALPALLFMVPFIAPAIVLAMVPPPTFNPSDAQPVRMPGGPGVPSWLSLPETAPPAPSDPPAPSSPPLSPRPASPPTQWAPSAPQSPPQWEPGRPPARQGGPDGQPAYPESHPTPPVPQPEDEKPKQSPPDPWNPPA